MINTRFHVILLILMCLIISSCTTKEEKSKSEEILGQKKIYEPNLKKRMNKQFEEGGGIFSTGKKGQAGTFEFATSNVLWRATLKTIDFLPLQSANYSGGLIITDWYSSSLDSKESIKIEIRFFSNELSSNSINIKSYKKICNETNNKCMIQKGSENFNSEIKNNILNEARKISIAEIKNKK